MLNLHHLADSSRFFVQDQWNAIWEWFGNDEFNMVVWGTFVVTSATYWVTGLNFLVTDLTGKPKFLQKYRIQKSSKYSVKLNKVLEGIKQILFNQIVCGIPVLFLYYHALKWRGYDSRRSLPILSGMMLEFLFFIFTEEIAFYYLHRLLHTPFLFKHIHNIHHEWNSPIAIIAAVCHPIEHIGANIFPLVLGPALLGSHLATTWIWFSIATVSTMISHSGFKIPQIPNPKIHDLHHTKPSRNYGVFGLLDQLHGTYEWPVTD